MTDRPAKKGMSGLALGTAALPFDGDGHRVREAEAVIREAVSRGVDWIDTAPLYQFGQAEAGVGRALAGLPRSAFRLSTKAGYVMSDEAIGRMRGGDGVEIEYPPKDFSFDAIMGSVERSLGLLGVDSIDAMFLHNPSAADIDVIRRGAVVAAGRLKEESVIGAVGVGVSDVRDALALIAAFDLDCLLIAGRYTLLDQSAGEQLLDACRERGVRVFAGGAMNSGLLANPHAARPRYNYRAATPDQISAAREIETICLSFGVPLRAAAVQFVRRAPDIEQLVLGPGSMPELENLLAMLNHPVPAELWDALIAEGFVRHTPCCRP